MEKDNRTFICGHVKYSHRNECYYTSSPLYIMCITPYKTLSTCKQTSKCKTMNVPYKTFQFSNWVYLKSHTKDNVSFCSDECFYNWYESHKVCCYQCAQDISSSATGEYVHTDDQRYIPLCNTQCKTYWINANKCTECNALNYYEKYKKLIDGKYVCYNTCKRIDDISCHDKAMFAYDCPYCKHHWQLNADKTPPFQFIKFQFDNSRQSFQLCGAECKTQFITKHTCNMCKRSQPPNHLINVGTPDVTCEYPESAHPTCYEIYRKEYLCNCCNTLCDLHENPQYGFNYSDDNYVDDLYYNICKTCCDKYKINTDKHRYSDDTTLINKTAQLLLLELTRERQHKSKSVAASSDDDNANDLDCLAFNG